MLNNKDMNLQISKINIITFISWVMLSIMKNRETKLVYKQFPNFRVF